MTCPHCESTATMERSDRTAGGYRRFRCRDCSCVFKERTGKPFNPLCQRSAEVVTTIISYEEQLRGWMAYLARTRSVAHQVETYRRLLQHLDNYRRIPVLAFDEAAAVVLQQLRHTRLRIGTVDLKIAAIVVSHDATLLSRHLADVYQVPGLQFENWAP
jgi:tRNA(fMet)-specific endonuclease VapC